MDQTIDQLREELAKAKADLEAAKRAGSRFLGAFSCEFRTPLNAVIGFSEFIAKEIKGPIGNSEYRNYAELINESANHLLNIINEVLDVARFDGGFLELQEEIVDLNQLMRDVLRLIAPHQAESKVNIRWRPASSPELYCDPRRMRQMLVNILADELSCKHPDGAVIEVGFEDTERPNLVIRHCLFAGHLENLACSPITSPMEQYVLGFGANASLALALIKAHGGTLSVDAMPECGEHGPPRVSANGMVTGCSTVRLWFPAGRLGRRAHTRSEDDSAGEVGGSRIADDFGAIRQRLQELNRTDRS